MAIGTTVESVQLGVSRPIDLGERLVRSGIDKRPAPRIEVRRSGADGDAIVADYHGGEGQAVYVYGRADYAFLERGLRVGALPGGTFGENVTVAAIPPEPRVGDRMVFGSGVVLEITGPRTPCATFAGRMRELIGPEAAKGWIERFRRARRPGVYCRVIEEGEIRPGMAFEVERTSPQHILVMELWDLSQEGSRDPDLIARARTSPVDHRIARWLAGLGG
jgi:MOSC domain-containing protein YiiM